MEGIQGHEVVLNWLTEVGHARGLCGYCGDLRWGLDSAVPGRQHERGNVSREGQWLAGTQTISHTSRGNRRQRMRHQMHDCCCRCQSPLVAYEAHNVIRQLPESTYRNLHHEEFRGTDALVSLLEALQFLPDLCVEVLGPGSV